MTQLKMNPGDSAWPVNFVREYNLGLTKREKLIFDLYVGMCVGVNAHRIEKEESLKNFAQQSIRAADILFEEMNKGE